MKAGNKQRDYIMGKNAFYKKILWLFETTFFQKIYNIASASLKINTTASQRI